MHTRSRLTRLAILLFATTLGGCQTTAEKSDASVDLAFPGPPETPRFYFERTVLGTADVQRDSEEDALRALLVGGPNRQGEGFSKPFDVAVHQGRVFVSDTVMRAVQVLDFAEGRAFRIGDEGGPGGLQKPLGLAVDRAGNLFVCDTALRTIQVYDRDGNYQRSIGDKETLQRPAGIDVDPEGDRLFVVDTGGVSSQKHQVQVFDATSGELVRTIGTRGTQEAEFNLPRDVTLGTDGLLYVTDGGNFRVQVLTQEGTFVREWGQPGARYGQFSRPKGIAEDPAGNVYAVDAAFGNFQIFNAEGQLLLFVGSRSTTPGPAKYMLPAGIDVDEDGRIYMIDQFYRKLDIYRPAALAENAGYLGRKE